MKNKQTSLIIALIAIITMSLTVCQNESDQPPSSKTFTVTFDADNGTESTTQTITEGGKVTEPSTPINNGYGFGGWYIDGEGEAWDFDTNTVSSDITLKAKWNLNKYTVTFNAGNGTENITKTVNHGDKVTEPENPTKANDIAGLYHGILPDYIFTGWQKPDGTEWNFSTTFVTSDITLTAKWTAPSPVNISLQNGQNVIVKAISYVKTNPGTFTFLLDTDIELVPQTIDVSNIKLTLIGLETERKINL